MATVGVVVLVFGFAIPRVASYGDAYDALSAMSAADVAVLVVILVVNVVTYWIVMVLALPGLRMREAAVVNQASTAVTNVVPAGSAVAVGVSFRMLRGLGFASHSITNQILLTGAWNQLVKFAMPLFAFVVAVLAGDFDHSFSLAGVFWGSGALVLTVAAAAAGLHSEQMARRVGAALDRPIRFLERRLARLQRDDRVIDTGGWLVRLRSQLLVVLRQRSAALSAAALLSHVSLFVVLLVAMRGLGVSESELAWPLLLAGFALVRLASSIPITPGSVGVVELGYVSVFSEAASTGLEAQITAAVLLFRAVTYVLPTALGVGAWLIYRRAGRWRAPRDSRGLEAPDQLPGCRPRRGRADRSSAMTNNGLGSGRRRAVLGVMLVAAFAFVLVTMEASNEPPAQWEVDLFTAVNGLPGWLYYVIWPFMQYGVFVTIPIATLVAWFLGRRRLAVMLGVSGIGIYLLAKVVKRVAGRGRPDALLAAVIEREHFAEGSIGYTSGHAAVAATIATLTVFELRRPLREITVGLVAIVFIGRMYVGAHLPLDLLGGIAMGIAAGTFTMVVASVIPTRDRAPTDARNHDEVTDRDLRPL